MSKVLDASALLVYLQKEPGYEKVAEALTHAAAAGRPLQMSAVNWGEVYYVTLKEFGRADADSVAELIETFPIEVVSADRETARQAGLFKVQNGLPYADAFAAALAKTVKGELMTSDQEFRLVKGDIQIDWL